MTPYQWPTTCQVCGGGGMATKPGWPRHRKFSTFTSHIDPRVCASVLRERERRMRQGVQAAGISA